MIDIANDEGLEAIAEMKRTLDANLESKGHDPSKPLILPQTMDSMYSLAHSAYSVENYAEAETVFMGMIMFSPDDARGWLGYAGACEAQQKWGQAIEGYAGLLGLAPDDPVPAYRAGVCWMALDDAESARMAFEAAARAADAGGCPPERMLYAERAQSMIRLLDDKAGNA